jgi:CheY-like chemotaxis protein
MAARWNFLVFDDDHEILEMLVELFEEPGYLGDATVFCKAVDNFNAALESVETGNFDLVILDLQDGVEDSRITGDESLSGEKVLLALKKNQFTPVIFHTGYPGKVKHLESHFVKIVRKGTTDQLMDVVKAAFDTKLPSLIRYIQEEQRKYLWDHVEQHWGSTGELDADGEVAYLLARRLASALSPQSIRKFFNNEHDAFSTVHPVEYYIWPSLNEGVHLGDIYVHSESKSFYLVINPACDFDQGKAESVLLVGCKGVEEFSEFMQIKDLVVGKKEISKSKRKELAGLLGDNRRISGGQPERYKYLPGTSFVPHLVADFQCLSQVSIHILFAGETYQRVATLDTPFAEGVQAKFSRYYGRFGVPDLNFESIATDLISNMGL